MVNDYMAATFFPSSPSFLSHPLAIRQPKLKGVIYVNFNFYSFKLFFNLLFIIKLISN